MALAKTEVFIIDPYLSDNIPSSATAIAAKYASGKNLLLRTSSEIHDRLILIDDRAWLAGQSIKNAAKKADLHRGAKRRAHQAHL